MMPVTLTSGCLGDELIGFVEETQPKPWAKLAKLQSMFLDCAKDIGQRGLLRVLREGTTFYGANALHQHDNMIRFLQVCGCEPPDANDSVSVYVEFAGPRDLWKTFDTDSARRAVVLSLLDPPNRKHLETVSIDAFNRHFGGNARDTIQSPSGLSVDRFDETLPDNDEFLRTCFFKWAFNAKPDLVIQIGENRCVCVEAKFESGEGFYPSAGREKTIFKRRGIPYVRQTDLQRYTMTQLLGFESDFVLIARVPSDGEHRFTAWREVFDVLNLSGLPTFMRTTIEAMAPGSRGI